MGRETLEPQELVAPEEFDRVRRRDLATRVAVAAALLAVLASISALEAEHGAAEAILAKNDAILWQSRASDEWAYRQAKSIKLHLQELAPGGVPDTEAQRADISASESRARTDEEQRDDANREAAEHFARHHRFAVATSLLQIAIVLETVAAVLDRPPLWWGGLAVGVVGAAALLNGFVGLL
ncbi:MAG: DUF4337 domain-containing protein [Deltaproteobacteria bacterium]|nr:MAG: DUF4337 domain-containing protein [Deltaproteobacteria bacterium]